MERIGNFKEEIKNIDTEELRFMLHHLIRALSDDSDAPIVMIENKHFLENELKKRKFHI